MTVRFAEARDLIWLQTHDHHVAEDELRAIVARQRILLLEDGQACVGWLRWNLFWDNTPFMNMLYVLEPHQRKGYGRLLVSRWEKLMQEQGYEAVMTSTLANEEAQHFYRALGYRDAGALLLPGEAAEIMFYKEIYT